MASEDGGSPTRKSVLALLALGIYARSIMQRPLWMLGVLLRRAFRLRRLRWLLAVQLLMLLWWSLAVPTETHRLGAEAWRGQLWLQSVGLLFWLEALMASWRSPAQEHAERVAEQSTLGELQRGGSFWAWCSTCAPLFWLLLLGGSGTWLLAWLMHPQLQMQLGLPASWLGQALFWAGALRALEGSRLSSMQRSFLLLGLGLGLLLFYPPERSESLGAWLGALALLTLLPLFRARSRSMFHVEHDPARPDVPRGTSLARGSLMPEGDERC